MCTESKEGRIVWISELEAVREEWGRLMGVCVRVDLERVGIIGGVGRNECGLMVRCGVCESSWNGSVMRWARDGDRRSSGYRDREGSGETKRSEVGGASR